ncbi:hypothetical protein [Psychrobacter sp. CAL346-MNA-CIBAN-0220]|uniref:hypothetical protein n=1 Tax=Psychrobacter sp. CAL346-MNA-CIBAN-0220 TaxID=3140457 RepID=UPI00331DC527
MSYLTAKFLEKKSLYLAVLLPTLLVGCSTIRGIPKAFNQTSFATVVAVDPVYLKPLAKGESAIEWVIMDPPLRSPLITYFDKEAKSNLTKDWAQIENKEILKLLSNTRSEISVSRLDSSGKIFFPIADANVGKGTYKVIMDYTPYIVEDVINPITKAKIGDARVGIGLRLTANITTNKANINIGSLMSLGIAAKLNQLKGTMHVDTIGIRLKDNSGMILLNTAIDETSILKTLEAMAIIQSKISDGDTHLDPQVLWVKPMNASFKPDQVAQQMTKPTVPAK